MALRVDGSTLWLSDPYEYTSEGYLEDGLGEDYLSISICDSNVHGSPEVVVGNAVFDVAG